MGSRLRRLSCRHDGVLLEVLASGNCESKLPLLIAPGLSEGADDYVDVIRGLAPRYVAALSFRGRGQSDAPSSGYTLEDHIGDMAAVVAELELVRFCILACSRGVSYALGYALQNPERVAGLVLGDYPPVHTALPPDMPAEFMTTTWRNKPAQQRIRLETLRAIQSDSCQVAFAKRLRGLRLPVLVLGGAPDRGALLSRAAIAGYETHLPRVEVRILAASGHDLRSPEPGPFMRELSGFLAKVDSE